MRVRDACTRDVISATRNLPVREAAQLMCAKHVGALVVVDTQSGRAIPVGVLTDRDILVALFANPASQANPDTLSVSDAMTAEPSTCDENADLLDAVALMQRRGVRRLPVVDESGALVGILAMDDIHGALVSQLRLLTQVYSTD